MSTNAGRVLVVDDDPQLRQICSQTLAREGFGVETAASAAAALAALGSGAYDLILLDIYMPNVDGLRLLEEIRARDISVPILLTSGMASVEQVAYAMRLGARGLLVKPFRPAELAEIAHELVAKRQAIRVSDRVAALRPVLQVSQQLLTELDLPRLYRLIIETVCVELGADRASLLLLDADGRALRIAACAGLPASIGIGTRVPVARSLSGWVASHRRPLLLDAALESSPLYAELRGRLLADPIAAALSMPVLAGERVLGVLNAAKLAVGSTFSEADQELLQLLAGQAAVALENTRLYTDVVSSEGRYRALLRHASDAVLLLDPAGAAVLDANLAMARLAGCSHAELLAMAPRELLPALDDLIATTADGRGDAGEIETALRTSADHETPVAVSISAVPDAGQRLLLVIARDISERQRMARELAQAEKLAAIGRLSAAMAHEINNPLQAISSAVRLLRRRDMPPEKRERYLAMTEQELDGLIRVVQRVLDLYRPSLAGMRPIDLNQLLAEVIEQQRERLAAAGIRLVSDCQPQLPLVAAVAGHLKQICTTLLQNAADAMPVGGELSVRTYLRPAEGEPDRAEFRAAGGGRSEPIEGPVVVLEVRDSGSGIAPDDLSKIFEPFFTTRSNGTGLGLALSYSIVEQHGGELVVSSQLGVGSTFRVALPAAR